MENIFISTGSGGNGKSLVNGMMMKTIGGYSYKLPSSVVMDALKTGANPEVANLYNKRFALVQEPDSKRPMCASTLKELTGDSELNVRKMYSNECIISLCLTLALECNKIPNIPDESADAIPRRLRIIPFDTKAVPKEKYELLEDKTGYCIQNSDYKKNEWQDAHSQALFEILLPYSKMFQDTNALPNVPEACKMKTNVYLDNNDPLYSWFCDFYEKGDSTDYLYVDALFVEYEKAMTPVGVKLTKEEKKNINKKKFLADVEESRYFRDCFKQRKTYLNKIQHSKPYIVGYRPIIKDIVEEELDITGCILTDDMIEEL